MPTTINEIEAAVTAALEPGFRGRLIARGQARAMIWRDGLLPAGAPEFSSLLTYDLKSFGFALLEQGLRLTELGGNRDIALQAFQQAAMSLEAVISRSDPNDEDRSFLTLIVAAAYHLARFSAQAYSTLARASADENFSFFERSLADLMLRNLTKLEADMVRVCLEGNGSDDRIVQRFTDYLNSADAEVFDEDDDFLFEGVENALIDNFASALMAFMLAMERGDNFLVDRCVGLLRVGLATCAELNLVPQWWSHKLAIHLIGDLWAASFHVNLPLMTQGLDAPDWPTLRWQFIALLLRRGKSEIDLWPSQIVAAGRAANQNDALVVSLPTSAGKTRIAELCILRCLASGKRVVFVTPLRALSAQTEVTLQRSFKPLGKRISALYGSIGVTDFDGDTMRESDIVVATPEKLDFALRNDPSLLDDVGLLVFDEGHMIGLNEREVRYEVQIQRLLRRSDASSRRIVCLSAILPEDDQLTDFVSWMTADQTDGAIKSDWRPTRLRFGEITWNNTAQTARLNIRVGGESPFVPRFLNGFVPPIGRRTTVFPKDLGELCLAAAWQLVRDGQSVLVFCPVRRHVEPFADRILKLNAQGALESLLRVDEGELRSALALGAETLGPDSSILKCLRLGVAIHHGALPTPFRKEVERLLQKGVLKVTISSPTLAQGLNLSATVVIIHSLFRHPKKLEAPEFRNVIGRAGRAFVDVEGLVLHPIYDNQAKRLADWEKLIADEKSREMESGLVRLLITLLQRLHRSIGSVPVPNFLEYIMNQPTTWDFPVIAGEKKEVTEEAQASWPGYVSSLDTAILSLMGEEDINVAEIALKLDEVLASSLWQRRLSRRNENTQNILKAGLIARATYIWQRSTHVQRRGYFLAGLGLSAGHALDAIASEANELLVAANGAILRGDPEDAISAITSLAEHVFQIQPFAPEVLPTNWRDILRAWLLGRPIATVSAGQESDTLRFVEGALVYRLPWAMESIRVRAIANGDTIGQLGMQADDFELGVAVPAVETGTLNRSAALLIQAGFDVRTVAINIVEVTGATFTTGAELRQWLRSAFFDLMSGDLSWPTADTHDIWNNFRLSFNHNADAVWQQRSYLVGANWTANPPPAPGIPIKIYATGDEQLPIVMSALGEKLGVLQSRMRRQHKGLILANVSQTPNSVDLSYTGPDDLWTR